MSMTWMMRRTGFISIHILRTTCTTVFSNSLLVLILLLDPFLVINAKAFVKIHALGRAASPTFCKRIMLFTTPRLHHLVPFGGINLNILVVCQGIGACSMNIRETRLSTQPCRRRWQQQQHTIIHTLSYPCSTWRWDQLREWQSTDTRMDLEEILGESYSDHPIEGQTDAWRSCGRHGECQCASREEWWPW